MKWKDASKELPKYSIDVVVVDDFNKFEIMYYSPSDRCWKKDNYLIKDGSVRYWIELPELYDGKSHTEKPNYFQDLCQNPRNLVQKCLYMSKAVDRFCIRYDKKLKIKGFDFYFVQRRCKECLDEFGI